VEEARCARRWLILKQCVVRPNEKGDDVSALSVVDLEAQADAVARFVDGWPSDQVLAWLGKFGEVKAIHIHQFDATIYSFRSRCGPCAAFLFAQDGRFVLIMDHTTYQPHE
jgi:hypothetical protein